MSLMARIGFAPRARTTPARYVQTRAVGRPAPRNSPLDRLWRWIVRAVYQRPAMSAFAHDIISAPLPVAVGTEIINICNADCSFCGYGKGEDGKGGDPRVKQKLNPEVFTHALKLFDAAGGGVFTLSPILGEVSVHPRWLDMVREARSFPNIKGVSCFTNGILLDRFGSDNILKSGLTNISFSTSLTGREAYNRLYGVDKYDTVVNNLFDLLETNKRLGRPVHITVLLRIDKPFAKFFASDIYERLCSLMNTRDIEILDDAWDGYKGLIKQEALPIGHKFKDNYPDKSVPCYAMFRKLEIMLDGTIQACACRIEPELWGGNILDHKTLHEAWRDPGLERLRNDWFEGKLQDCCKTCEHYIPYTNLLRPTEPKRVARHALGRVKRAVLGSTRQPIQF